MQGTVFCVEHQNCPMAPRNGCEKPYRPELYNKDPSVYKSHNCYSYAMSVIDKRNIEACKKNGSKNCRQFFHQPGALHGDRFALNAVDRRKCAVVEKLIMKDSLMCLASVRALKVYTSEVRLKRPTYAPSPGVSSHLDSEAPALFLFFVRSLVVLGP